MCLSTGSVFIIIAMIMIINITITITCNSTTKIITNITTQCQ